MELPSIRGLASGLALPAFHTAARRRLEDRKAGTRAAC